MSNPFAVQPGGVIQGQGVGGSIAQGLAGVLAQMQITKENQFRQQELANAQAQQQALQRYYEAQAQAQQQELSMKAGEQAIMREGQRQVGGAQRAALYGGPPEAQGLFSQALQGGAQSVPPQSSLPSLFTGVSDANMGAAVKGVQEVQQLTPRPPEPATSQKEYEYYNRLRGRDPQQAELYRRLFLEKTPQTVINNIPAAGETEFSKKLAEAQVSVLTKNEAEARSSTQAFPAMAEAYKLVDKSFTGFGANQLLAMARIAGAAGFKPSKDKVADSQTLMKLTRDQTLAYLQTRALGSGTAVSDRDREFMERQSAADLTLDPRSIKRIIRINVGTGIMRMKEAIDDLHDQAMAYPQNARQLNTKAAAIQRTYDVQWRAYTQMLKQEEKDDQINVPEAVDSLFPRRR